MVFVTDYMLDRHAELIPVYERLGKEDIARRARMRYEKLKAIKERQENKVYNQTKLF